MAIAKLFFFLWVELWHVECSNETDRNSLEMNCFYYFGWLSMEQFFEEFFDYLTKILNYSIVLKNWDFEVYKPHMQPIV